METITLLTNVIVGVMFAWTIIEVRSLKKRITPMRFAIPTERGIARQSSTPTIDKAIAERD